MSEAAAIGIGLAVITFALAFIAISFKENKFYLQIIYLGGFHIFVIGTVYVLKQLADAATLTNVSSMLSVLLYPAMFLFVLIIFIILLGFIISLSKGEIKLP